MKSDWSKLEVLFQLKHDAVVRKLSAVVDEIRILEDQIRHQRLLFRLPDNAHFVRRHQGNIRHAGALQEHRVQELNHKILQLLVQKDDIQKQTRASFQKLTSVQELKRREAKSKSVSVNW